MNLLEAFITWFFLSRFFFYTDLHLLDMKKIHFFLLNFILKCYNDFMQM